uniref:Uncharacterized protein n=1 Tax=Zea mays TaxID=4577 RepID=B6TVT6_MAIZE|nr:hypothetical protein [Zea mays]
MTGFSFWDAIASTTSLVKVPPLPEVPISTVGFRDCTASSRVATGSCSCAHGFLNACSESFRDATIRPLESISQIFGRHSSIGDPVCLYLLLC